MRSFSDVKTTYNFVPSSTTRLPMVPMHWPVGRQPGTNSSAAVSPNHLIIRLPLALAMLLSRNACICRGGTSFVRESTVTSISGGPLPPPSYDEYFRSPTPYGRRLTPDPVNLVMVGVCGNEALNCSPRGPSRVGAGKDTAGPPCDAHPARRTPDARMKPILLLRARLKIFRA